MKLPRTINGEELSKCLKLYGYEVIRQRGEHKISVPNHIPVKAGTLASIVKEVANHFDETVEEVKHKLFGDG